MYKHQELKPSILRTLSEQLQLAPQPPRANYASFKDILYLEDEVLRVKLVGSHMNIQDVVTGVICAVLGHKLENGSFSVNIINLDLGTRDAESVSLQTLPH